MSVAHKVSVQGVVIARRAMGEGSVKVELYTDALGLVSAIAQSARLERSKLRPHLTVGTHGTYSLVKGRDMWRTTGATLTQNAYFVSHSSPAAQASALQVLSFVRQFVRGEGSDPKFFAALSGFLLGLPYTEVSVKDAECLAVVRMLSALGYVEPNPAVSSFLTEGYDEALLTHAKAKRTVLVQTINEGLSVSSL